MEELKIKITIERNREEFSKTVNFSDFLNQNLELTSDYVQKILNVLVKSVLIWLEEEKLVIPSDTT